MRVAGDSVGRVALLAVRPGFARLILEGRKKVEFRKVRFAREVSHVLMYATAPVMRIVGCFTVRGIEEAPPRKLWQRYERVGGIAKDAFWRYYARSRTGVAIRVGEVVVLGEPMTLKAAGCSRVPPQSFRYVDPGVLHRAIRVSRA
jgi:predicted transcriptional regulator